ncbi:unnamed protein product [Pieris macdunnoughi]|uniref:Uncharacterized protein n=1 Tax=Pieris macdunnoughi TaxID=345717 RepID=A0A821XS70_9NEOP|nr:unnamed protein product [Pieris macdunnoughi]
MYVWDKTIASMGLQEIGSCLLRFIKEKVKTKKLIVYSDQCSGQNRNIKMATLCQYIVAHTDYTVDNIDHKFYVSGHSYLACDQDFGLVEKKKKFFKNIYLPDHWTTVIKWLSIQWLLFNKMHPFTLLFKYSNNEDVLFENVDLKKRGSTDLTGIKLDPLYPDGQSISCEKKKDLLDLLPSIPPVYHSFYTSY